MGDVTTPVLHVLLSVTFAGPHHLAVLARPVFVRAAPALPGITRIGLPSASPSCCDRISGAGLSPPLESQRLTAQVLVLPLPAGEVGRDQQVHGEVEGVEPSPGAGPVPLHACAIQGGPAGLRSGAQAVTKPAPVSATTRSACSLHTRLDRCTSRRTTVWPVSIPRTASSSGRGLGLSGPACPTQPTPAGVGKPPSGGGLPRVSLGLPTPPEHPVAAVRAG